MKPILLTSTEGFAEAIKTRRHEMGITHLEADDLIGIADGHMSKIEAFDRPWGKRPFNMTFVADWILQCLGLAVVIMDREEALAMCDRTSERKYNTRQSWIEPHTVGRRYSWVVRHRTGPSRPLGGP